MWKVTWGNDQSVYFTFIGTSEEAGGFPNVEFNPEHSVEGCVYAITETELAMLDNCMGYPKVGDRTGLHYFFVLPPFVKMYVKVSWPSLARCLIQMNFHSVIFPLLYICFLLLL